MKVFLMNRIFSKICIFGRTRSRFVVVGMSGLKLLVVSGPSGTGKSTLLKKLLEEYPNKCGFSVSHTTRNPRHGEINGKDYHFCTRDFMEEMIKNGEFLEHAEYSRNLYGTSKKAVKDVQDQGKICILDVDRQGVLNVKGTDMESHFLFVKPPSMQELEKRLRNRKTETEDTIQRRLNIAKADLEYAAKPDSYDSIVVNDVLEESYIEFKEVIKKAICPLD